MSLAGTVQNGPLLVAAGVSAMVGVVGFLSPCVLPLVPGYLSYVAGLSGAADRRRTVLGAFLFVLGFTAVLVAEGALFGTLGQLIQEHAVLIERVLGGITVLLGLVFLGWVRPLQREVKVHRLPQAGLLGAPVLGVTFGLAWTPCLTPTFSVVFGLAYSQGTAARGALLMVAYCLGLGVPFLLVAFGLGWVTGALSVLRRHGRLVSQVGGALLVVIGFLLLSGTWDHWMAWLRSSFGTTAGFNL